jgi:MOSC domain-containing protein YiiM
VPAIISSRSVGDPRTFQSRDVLEARLGALTTPRDAGRIVLIVRRVDHGVRETLERTTLTPQAGIPGDAWGRGRNPSVDAQLTVMQADVATLIANGQPLPLFGDNLYVDLDLSTDNLPTGSRLRAGGVTLEVTPLPHNGCSKFQSRFGADALRCVSRRDLRHLNLRGVYMRAVDTGEIAAGDSIDVLSRP